MDLSTATNVAFALIAVFAAALTGLAALALRRSPSSRMAMVTAGFGLLAVQGVIVGYGLLAAGWDAPTLLFITALFEGTLLVVLFVATLLR